jgi:hypothetical protein
MKIEYDRHVLALHTTFKVSLILMGVINTPLQFLTPMVMLGKSLTFQQG